MRIAVIGLGVMGLPIAENLVKAGFDVRGYNRSRRGPDRLVAAGGRTASALAEAIASAELVITVLPDTPDVEAVVTGPEGILEQAQPQALWIDMSTISPSAARRLAAAAQAQGLRALDAPVSGGEAGAIDGALSIMVGGHQADFESALPVLQAVGRTIVHVGGNGSGQIVKAANQLIVASNLQALAEGIAFLDTHSEVDIVPALRAISGGLAGSRVLDQKAEKMLSENFSPGFRLALHDKDLRIFADAALRAGLVSPLGEIVRQLLADAVERGDGALDHSALYKQLLALSGERRRPDAAPSNSNRRESPGTE